MATKGHHNQTSTKSDGSTPLYRTPSEKAFSVLVHVNNDQFNPGKKMLVSMKRLRNFDNFLQECTDKLKPVFGGVRRLYTSRGRRRILSLDELEDDTDYVITGTEHYKKHNYKDIIGPPKPNRNYKAMSPPRIQPVVHPRDANLRNQHGKAMELASQKQGLILHVHENGRNERAAHHISISSGKKKTLEQITEEIQTKFGLQKLRGICLINNEGGCAENFIPVTDVESLQPNSHVLVIPEHKHLEPKVYRMPGKQNFRVDTSPRTGQPWAYEDFPLNKRQYKHNYKLNKKRPLPSIGSSKQSDTLSPFSNTPGSQTAKRGNKSKGRGEVDYDKDPGGVFKAKKQNNAHGAHQVNDSQETRTDKPIDQMEAEIVKEERVDEDAGMHHTNEFEDDSFNRYDQNTSGAMSKDPRSSTPASRAEEERQKREQREYEAAAKIQAGARAYKARKEYNHMKEAKRQEMDNQSHGLEEARRREAEALHQQEQENEEREREMEEARRQAEQQRDKELAAEKKQMAEDQAATKIQASFKGHKARKEYQARKQQVRADKAKKSKNEKEVQAATKIQSSYRGYKVRREYNSRKRQVKKTDINDNEKKEGVGKKKMNEDEAAVAIQAGFKGYKTRKEVAQKKAQKKAESDESKVENTTDSDKQQREAATKIQSSFRGYKARKRYTEKKEHAKAEQKSATRIQASFRGYRARKEMSEKKKEPQLPDQAPSSKDVDREEMNRAATKIQSGFRGYRARKEYKAKGQQ